MLLKRTKYSYVFSVLSILISFISMRLLEQGVKSLKEIKLNWQGFSKDIFKNIKYKYNIHYTTYFSVKFEYSNCDNNTSDVSSPGDDHHNDEAAIDLHNDEDSNSKNKSHNLTIFAGFEGNLFSFHIARIPLTKIWNLI